MKREKHREVGLLLSNCRTGHFLTNKISGMT
jgi:hypothetical protein